MFKSKRLVQDWIRMFHLRFMRRPLPNKLGIYFHRYRPFERQALQNSLLAVKALGYRFVGPDEFLKSDGKVAFLSFDDNYQEWIETIPFFEEHEIHATFFLNTCVFRGECTEEELGRYHKAISCEGSGIPLSRAEVRSLALAGHTIGAHTHAHVSLATLSSEEIVKELGLNVAIIQEITGQEVKHMSFPYGMPRFCPPYAEAACLSMGFQSISWGVPAMQYSQGEKWRLHRTGWELGVSIGENLAVLGVAGHRFVNLTGRSPMGYGARFDRKTKHS